VSCDLFPAPATKADGAGLTQPGRSQRRKFLELEKTPKTKSEKHRLQFSIIQEQQSLTLWSKKRYLKSGVGLQPAGITPRVLQSSHVKSQSQEKQHEVASNHLTVIATV